MPKPERCRIVTAVVDPAGNNGTDEAVAVITRVWNDRLVNLRVLHDGPDTSWYASVHLYDTREEVDEARAGRIADNEHLAGTWWAAAYWPSHAFPHLHPGAIVQYRGKQGLQAPRGALVTATADTLDPRGVDAGDVAPLTTAEHVHLFVLTPSDALGFPEYDVPRDEPGMCRPGMWQWPS
jgi:hypothetical protein